MNEVQIFDYSDYRQFLKDRFEQQKSLNPSFTYRYIALKTGLSHSLLQMILKGRRNLTTKTIKKLIPVFNLSKQEEEYFEALVHFNQTTSLEEKNYYFERMLELRKEKSWYNITADKFSYFDEWHHPIIRELATTFPFQNNYKVLAGQVNPPITEHQAKESVELLTRIGFLKKGKDGTYTQDEPIITSGGALNKERVIAHQIKIFEKAKESLIRLAPNSRYTSTTTFGISQETFQQIVNRIRNNKEELLELAKQDNQPEHVYQMLIHIMPVSQQEGDNL